MAVSRLILSRWGLDGGGGGCGGSEEDEEDDNGRGGLFTFGELGLLKSSFKMELGEET